MVISTVVLPLMYSHCLSKYPVVSNHIYWLLLGDELLTTWYLRQVNDWQASESIFLKVKPEVPTAIAIALVGLVTVVGAVADSV